MHHALQPAMRTLVLTAATIMLAFSAIAAAKAGTRTNSINVGITIGGPTASTARYTCGAATTLISMAGFTNIQPQICTGDLYLFSVLQGVSPAIIQFDATTGNINDVQPVN